MRVETSSVRLVTGPPLLSTGGVVPAGPPKWLPPPPPLTVALGIHPGRGLQLQRFDHVCRLILRAYAYSSPGRLAPIASGLVLRPGGRYGRGPHFRSVLDQAQQS